jgi:hypothetical protein
MPHGVIQNDIFGFSVLNYHGQPILSALVHQNIVSVMTVLIINNAIWPPCHMASSDRIENDKFGIGVQNLLLGHIFVCICRTMLM